MRTAIVVLVISLLTGGMVTLVSGRADAWAIPCDFLTGGGFIITRGYTVTGGAFFPIHDPAKANFGVGGSCKRGGDGHGLWGHLEYIDHGNGLNVHWTTITGYTTSGETGTDPKTGQPTGARIICGTARTNLYGDVDWAVGAVDKGEPGVNDEFVIRLRKFGVTVYTTEGPEDHTLGGTGPGGGNIQLHKPNPSITGDFGGTCDAAPEFF